MNSDRYSRQIRFTAIGKTGQNALFQAHAAIVGCGALGSVSAELLVRAGVGRVTVIDRDYVELSNLQRQTLFDESDAESALPKAVAAERRLRAINSDTTVSGVVDDLRSSNAVELLDGADVIVDATDNFEARYLINDYSVSKSIPWVYGAAVGSYGISMPVLPGDSACFRCIYPTPPTGLQPTCETAGVLNVVTSTIGSLQASVALQILSGNRAAVRRKMTTIDLWYGPLRELQQPERDAECPCCARGEYEWLSGGHDTPISLCGRNAVQIHARGKVDLPALRARLSVDGEVRANDFALRFIKGEYEMTVFADGRAIIKGTTDIAAARSWYARWVSA